MSVKPTLSTQLSQRLVLTPQLRQRIEMLQMTKLELNELVTQQLMENPVLEEVPPEEITVTPAPTSDSDGFGEAQFANGSAEAGEDFGALNGSRLGSADQPTADFTGSDYPSGESFDPGFEAATGAQDFQAPAAEIPEAGEGETRERDSFEEVDFGSTFEEYLDPGYRTRETEVKETPSFEQFLSSEQTLYDHLLWQLSMTVADDDVRDAAEAIIGNLDDDGLLIGTTLEELAALGQWNLETVEKALELVQQFDPTGVGARSLQESLLIQLRAHDCGERLAAQLITSYFHKLQTHKWPELARELGITVEELANEVKLIRQLDPHPGRKYAPSDAHYIEPEVYIEKMDDEYIIRFNDDGLPQLRINTQYRRMMENKETAKETRDFIKDRFRSAVDLLKNIEHRKQTIYRVCERIVERQREFLDKGVEHLKPMMLKDISEDIGMHLSTISRVVNGKYAHTPQGVIELRRFFTEGMTNDDGEEVSTRIIKLKIKKMIEAEDARNPLTDDELAARLAAEGQKLSRRTVAKYRDQMKIPGSRERRQVV
ncbi:MAG TPA: RNA polymerase factor sigma-54 [Blastocatellia bacterium]|nr:RNA polymerase factor sigma-54 [Blastocatellia bacterium]